MSRRSTAPQPSLGQALRRDGGALRHGGPPGPTPPAARQGQEPAPAKAGVEAAVLIIERWRLGRLRHRRFYSLAELNATIGEMLRQLNEERLIRRLGVTRRALLEELDRLHFKEVPGEGYCFAAWRARRGRLAS